MLIGMTSGGEIRRMPYEREYKGYLSPITDKERQEAKTALNAMIGQTEIQTSSWMSGNDWLGTVSQPIGETTARQSHEGGAKCFRLFVVKIFIERRETWTSGRFEKDGIPLRGRTYFSPRL